MPCHHDLLVLRLLDQYHAVLVQSAFDLVRNIIGKDHSEHHTDRKKDSRQTIEPDVFHPLTKLPHDQKCGDDI